MITNARVATWIIWWWSSKGNSTCKFLDGELSSDVWKWSKCVWGAKTGRENPMSVLVVTEQKKRRSRNDESHISMMMIIMSEHKLKESHSNEWGAWREEWQFANVVVDVIGKEKKVTFRGVVFFIGIWSICGARSQVYTTNIWLLLGLAMNRANLNKVWNLTRWLTCWIWFKNQMSRAWAKN